MNSSDPLGPAPTRPSFDRINTPAPRSQTWSVLIQIFCVVVGIGLMVRVGWSLWHSGTGDLLAAPNPNSPPLKGELLPSALPEESWLVTGRAIPPRTPYEFAVEAEANRPKPATTDLVATQARADAAKALQFAAVQQGIKLSDLLDAWQLEVDLWNKSVEPLLTSDSGKAIAADLERMRSFRVVYDQQRTPLERIGKIRTDVTPLMTSNRAAFDDVANERPPLASTKAILAAAIDEAQTATQELKGSREQIEAIAAVALQFRDRATVNLQRALVDLKMADQLAASAELRRKSEDAEQNAAEAIAKAQTESIRIAGEVQARKILDAAVASKAEQNVAEERNKAAREKEKRLAAMEQDLADIKKYLAPFIAKGYAQPTKGNNIQTGDSIPISLSKLESSGALNGSREGMEQLMRVATVTNDRDAGGFPQYVGGDFNWQQTNKEYVKRAQELLTKYGDLLVEKGLLSQ